MTPPSDAGWLQVLGGNISRMKAPLESKAHLLSSGVSVGQQDTGCAGPWLGSLSVTSAMGRQGCLQPPRLSPGLCQSSRVYPSRCWPWQEVRGGPTDIPRDKTRHHCCALPCTGLAYLWQIMQQQVVGVPLPPWPVPP